MLDFFSTLNHDYEMDTLHFTWNKEDPKLFQISRSLHFPFTSLISLQLDKEKFSSPHMFLSRCFPPTIFPPTKYSVYFIFYFVKIFFPFFNISLSLSWHLLFSVAYLHHVRKTKTSFIYKKLKIYILFEIKQR